MFNKILLWLAQPLMNSRYKWVNRLVVRSLGWSKDVRTVNAIIASIKNPDDFDIWEDSLKALVRIGAVAIDPLANCLKDEDSHLRASAAYVLYKIGTPRTVEPLIFALKDTEARLRQYMFAIGPREYDRKRDDQVSIGKFAAEALGKIGDIRAVTPLISYSRMIQSHPERNYNFHWHGPDNISAASVKVAVSALERMLLGKVSSIDTDSLFTLANLQLSLTLLSTVTVFGPKQTRWGPVESYEDHITVGLVDCSRVNKLAQEELIRRGLKT